VNGWKRLDARRLSVVSLITSAAFFAAMIGTGIVASTTSIVVYAVSFWQYWIYALAFLYRATSLPVFKRDALITRSASLVALAWVYFAEPLNALSIVVVAVGFLLNAAAVAVLGTDRTYYGAELAELPPRHVDAFPYSWMSHPMLIGNMIAFCGTLLHPEFRQKWLPLAALHVVLNLAIILMEAFVRPRNRRASPQEIRPTISLAGFLSTAVLWSVVGAIAAAAILAGSINKSISREVAAFVGACCAGYAYILFASYTLPHEAAGGAPAS
jgi:hypothetical protein